MSSILPRSARRLFTSKTPTRVNPCGPLGEAHCMKCKQRILLEARASGSTPATWAVLLVLPPRHENGVCARQRTAARLNDVPISRR